MKKIKKGKVLLIGKTYLNQVGEVKNYYGKY